MIMKVVSFIMLGIGTLLSGLAIYDLHTSSKPFIAYLLKYPIMFTFGIGIILLIVQVSMK